MLVDSKEEALVEEVAESRRQLQTVPYKSEMLGKLPLHQTTPIIRQSTTILS